MEAPATAHDLQEARRQRKAADGHLQASSRQRARRQAGGGNIPRGLFRGAAAHAARPRHRRRL
jgi:hypothetical protein